jgi:hypothetical protein
MLSVEKRSDGVLHVVAEAWLRAGDYDGFVARFAQLAQKPSAILMELRPGFRGWTLPGLVRDLRFDIEHRHRFGRIAVVGHRSWEKWLTGASALLFPYPIRFFYAAHRAEAEAWLEQFRPAQVGT